MSDSRPLSPRQVRAIAALTTCRTIKEAAKQARCGESSVRRWLAKDVAFQAAWQDARTALVRDAIAQAQRSSEQAALTLHHIMMHSDVDYTKVAAATRLLDIAVKALERDELVARLQALEAALKNEKDLGI